MAELPKIRRKALLPAVDFREPADPSQEVLEQFRIHDLLLFIGYLREQGITFRDLSELKKQMPRLHKMADKIIGFKSYFRREGGRRYAGEGWSYGSIHRPNLVVSRSMSLAIADAYYQNNRAPEIVILLRRLYSEGWSLESEVMEREGRSLHSACSASLLDVCDDADFKQIPSVKLAFENMRKGSFLVYDVRNINRLEDGNKIKDVHVVRYYSGWHHSKIDPVGFGAMVAGIDARIAREEASEYKTHLLEHITTFLDKGRKIPADVVKKLRKHFGGRDRVSLVVNVLEQIRESRGLSYTGYFPKEIVGLFDEAGFSDVGFIDKEFALWKQRSLDERCEESFVRLYKLIRNNRPLDGRELRHSYKTAHNALWQRYGGNWDNVLVAYYGLEDIRFHAGLDPDTATVDARNIADELRLEESNFYKFARKIGLPLATRETVRHRFLHTENATLLLERVRIRYEKYEKR